MKDSTFLLSVLVVLFIISAATYGFFSKIIHAAAHVAVATSTAGEQRFIVNGSDTGANRTTITVQKRSLVRITFGADAGATYHEGIDFRSPVVSTGPIAPGSTKTISFIATDSFSFNPYWPATNIEDPYTIKVNVH